MLLIDAVVIGDLGLIHELISKDLNAVKELDEFGQSALHWAAKSDRDDIANILISNGADKDLKDEEGWAPLYVACVANSTKVGLLLLDSGADPNALNDKGESPIF